MGQRAEQSWSKLGPAVLAAGAIALVALGTRRLHGLFLNTALLSIGVLAVALPLGIVLGLAVAKVDVAGRRTLKCLLVALLFVPLYVQAGAWHSVFGPGGWWVQRVAGDSYADPLLAGWRGAIWVHAMAAVPWAALAIAAALAAVERRLEEQALLDAPPWQVLLAVSLRRAGGGVAAATAWIVATCATEFVITDLYQVRTFAEEVYTEASLGLLVGPLPGGGGAGIPLGVTPTEPFVTRDLTLGVIALALMLVAAARSAAPWLVAVATTPGAAGWTWRPARRGASSLALWGVFAAFALVPVAGLVWKSGLATHLVDGVYRQSWSAWKVLALTARSPWEHRREWGWSVEIGALAAIAATSAALVLAWQIRTRRRLAAPVAAALAILAALPAPLLGVWVITALNRPLDSPLSGLAVLYDRTLAAPVFVQAMRALPLVTLWLWSQLATISDDLLDAARSEGASRWRQFWSIVLPQRRVAVAAALAATLAIAVAELSATVLVVPPGVTTISVRVFQMLHFGVDDRASALCLSIFATVGLGVAVASELAARRKRSDPPAGPAEPPLGDSPRA